MPMSRRLAAALAVPAVVCAFTRAAGADTVDLGGGNWRVTAPSGTPVDAVGGTSVEIDSGATVSGDASHPAITTDGTYTITNSGVIRAGSHGSAVYAHTDLHILGGAGSAIVGDLAGASASSLHLGGDATIDGTVGSPDDPLANVLISGGGHTTINGNGHVSGEITISGADVRWNGVIANNGSVRVEDGGTLTINGANVVHFYHVEGSRLDAATTQSLWQLITIYADDATLGSGGGTEAVSVAEVSLTGSLTLDGALDLDTLLLNNGTRTIHLLQDAAISGGIHNGGLAIEAGAFTLSITGQSDYAGGTTIESGTIAVNGTSPLGTGVVVLSGGSLAASNFASLDNDFRIESDAGLDGTLELNGDIDLAGGERRLTVTWPSGTLMRGDLSHGSLIKAGDAPLLLRGNATLDRLVLEEGMLLFSEDVTGDILVEGGTLSAQGRHFGDLHVRGGEAWMSGSTSGDVRVSGGRLMAISDNTSVAGNLSVESGGVFVASVSRDLGTFNGEPYINESIGKLTVGGAAAFAPGSSLLVRPFFLGVPASEGERFTVLQAEGGITIPEEVLASVASTTDLFAFSAELVGDDELVIELIGSYTDAGSVGSAIIGDLFYTELGVEYTLLSGAGRERAERRLSPVAHEATGAASVDAVRGANATMGNYFRGQRLGLPALAAQQGGEESASLASAAAFEPTTLANYLDAAEPARDAARAPRREHRGWGGFAMAFDSYVDEEAHEDSAGFDANTAGVHVGLDRGVADDLLVGWSFGYAYTAVTLGDAGGDGDVHGLRTGPYLSWTPGDFFLDAALTAGYHRNQTDRRVVVGGFDATAESDYDAYDASLYLGAGYDLAVGEWTFTPEASLQYTHYAHESYDETGAGAANLSVGENDTDAFRTRIGARVSRIVDLAGHRLLPEASLGWAHQFDAESDLSARFVGGVTPFTTRVGTDARDSLYLGAGLSALLSDTASAYVRYEGEFATESQSHTLLVGVNVRF